MQQYQASSSNVVQCWFGLEFSELNPLLQRLHIDGGVLEGPVEIKIATGLTGLFARRLATRLNIPLYTPNPTLRVEIFEKSGALHWNRIFNGSHQMLSVFEPVGAWPSGYWIESTGLIRLALSVNVKNSAWHWRTQKVWLKGVRLPLVLLPRTTAYKCIEGNRYRFYVGFSFPFLGTFLSYSGILTALPTVTLP